MGAFSPLFRGQYFRLQNSVVERSTDGANVDFAAVGSGGVAYSDITDAFLADVSGQGYVYANSAANGFVRVQEAIWAVEIVSAAEYNAVRSAAGSIVLDGSTAPILGSPAVAIETNLDLTGHQIKNLAAGVAQTDGVNVSQLEASIGAVTTAYQAADLAIAGDLNALEVVVANLPQGITMAQVQSAIDAKVAEAVLAEVIDDAQAQAIVDAALATLANLDVTILGRLTTAEADIDALEPRITVVEGQVAGHTTAINTLNDSQAVQDAAIGSLTTSVANQGVAIAGLDTRVGAVEGSLVTLNNADTVLAGRATSTEAALAAMVAAMLPVAVSVANGAIVAGSNLNVPVANVAVAATNATHQSISVTLPSGMAGQERSVKTSRLAANGSYVECCTGVVKNGDTYVISGLKESNGMGTLKICLGYAG